MTTFDSWVVTLRPVRQKSELYAQGTDRREFFRAIPVPDKARLCEKIIPLDYDWMDWTPEKITKDIVINGSGNIWLYFLGCTDGTHAPDYFRETEDFAYCYRGFIAKLIFEETRTSDLPFASQVHAYRTFGYRSFNFKTVCYMPNSSSEVCQVSRREFLGTVKNPEDYLISLERSLCEYCNHNRMYDPYYAI
jgi:hypothetical protein